MKKRALILAMIAFIAATTSEPSINMVRAEETQVDETQTEENAGQTSELPIKTLTPKAMDVNPYMAASDSNIHHDCYNTDSTDEVLPVDIYSEINVSYEKTNANASPAIFFDRPHGDPPSYSPGFRRSPASPHPGHSGPVRPFQGRGGHLPVPGLWCETPGKAAACDGCDDGDGILDAAPLQEISSFASLPSQLRRIVLLSRVRLSV